MTLPQIYERISALPTGGYITSDNRLDRGQMYSMINSARAFVIQQRYLESGVVPPSYYQQLSPEYNEDAQDSTCYAKFYGIPRLIAIGEQRDGMGYVGSVVMNVLFRQCNSRAEFASMQTDRIMKAGRKAYVLVGNSFIEVYYKNKIKEILIEGLFEDPTKVLNYNVDVDDYPIEISDISRMESYLMQTDLNMISRTPVDRIKNDRDDAAAPQTR